MALTDVTIKWTGSNPVLKIDGNVVPNVSGTSHTLQLAKGTHNMELTTSKGSITKTLNVPDAVADLVETEITNRHLKTQAEVDSTVRDILSKSYGYIDITSYKKDANGYHLSMTLHKHSEMNPSATADTFVISDSNNNTLATDALGANTTERQYNFDFTSKPTLLTVGGYVSDSNTNITIDTIDLDFDITEETPPVICEHWTLQDTITTLKVNKQKGDLFYDGTQVAVFTFGSDHLEFDWELDANSSSMFRGVYEDTANPNANPKYKVLRIRPRPDKIGDFTATTYKGTVTFKKPGTDTIVAEAGFFLDIVNNGEHKTLKFIDTDPAITNNGANASVSNTDKGLKIDFTNPDSGTGHSATVTFQLSTLFNRYQYDKNSYDYLLDLKTTGSTRGGDVKVILHKLSANNTVLKEFNFKFLTESGTDNAVFSIPHSLMKYAMKLEIRFDTDTQYQGGTIENLRLWRIDTNEKGEL